MKKTVISLLIVWLLFPFSVGAQTKPKGRKAPARPTAAAAKRVTPENALFRELLPATAKLLFVDSVVVDKQDFLSKIPMSRLSGSILTTKEFLGRTQYPEASAFINGIGNQAFFADGDTLQTAIYSTDRLGGKWDTPVRIAAIDDKYRLANYPFVQSDGVTLYFAAQGVNSIGGYDLFMTRYNREEHRFYAPENMGLPYNSTANDYLLAIDDANELGWLVTDRNMPEGKVCIYTFVPTKQRLSYADDHLTPSQLEAQARIQSIAMTWKNGDRQAALGRLKQLATRGKVGDEFKAGLHFVVNDGVTLENISDFKAENRQNVSNLLALRNNIIKNEVELQLLRDSYASLSRGKQQAMRQQILDREKELEQQQLQITRLEKEIRNIENHK